MVDTDSIIRQIELEDKLKSAAEEKFKEAFRRGGAGSVGGEKIMGIIPAFAEEIDREIRPRGQGGSPSKLSIALRNLAPYGVAANALCIIINRMVSNGGNDTGAAKLSAEIGKALLLYAELERTRDDNPEHTAAVGERKNNSVTIWNWERRGISIKQPENWDSILVGAKILGAAERAGIVSLCKSKSLISVKSGMASDAINEALESGIAYSSGSAPLIIPPRDWEVVEGRVVGGYYGAMQVERMHFMRSRSKVADMVSARLLEYKTVIQAINKMQRVPWRVSAKLLSVAEGMASSDKDRLTVWEASRISDEPRLYFVWSCDYRGRLYAAGSLINPQGDDLQKSLLESADGQIVSTPGAINMMRLGIAGKYGIDKVSIADRLAWFDDHEKDVLLSGNDPKGAGLDFWQAADKPWQFLQAAMDYAEWKKDPLVHRCRVAVPLDGTCSGIQHFSAMGRDPIGARATNLARSSVTDAPRDIYADVAKVVIGKLEAAGDDMARAWLSEGVDRKTVKRSVMTTPYNVREQTMATHVMEHCSDTKKMNGMRFEAASYLRPILWNAIPEVVLKARDIMGWLGKCSRQICNENTAAGIPVVTWKSPNGVPIFQSIDEMKRSKIKVNGRTISAVKAVNGKPDIKRHYNAFSPNFVHACDAAHMHRVINRMECDHMHMIHDSFGALPEDAENMSRIVREEFVSMYESWGAESLAAEYPSLPKPPERGSFDIGEVLHSQYAFS